MTEYPVKITKELHNDNYHYNIEFLNFEKVVLGKVAATVSGDINTALDTAKEVLDSIIRICLRENTYEPPLKIEGENIHYIRPDITLELPLIFKRDRQKLGVSMGVIARKIGMAAQNYHQIESGARANLTLKTINKITGALNSKAQLTLSEI